MLRGTNVAAVAIVVLLGTVPCVGANEAPASGYSALIEQFLSDTTCVASRDQLLDAGVLAVPALESALDRRDDVILRERVVDILLRMAKPASAKAIKKALSDPEQMVRRAALAALSDLHRGGVIDKSEL